MRNKPNYLILLILSLLTIVSGLPGIFNFNRSVNIVLFILGAAGAIYSTFSSEMERISANEQMDELATILATNGLGNKYLNRLKREIKNKGWYDFNKAVKLLYEALALNPKDLEALILLSAILTLNLCFKRFCCQNRKLSGSVNEVKQLLKAGYKIDPKNNELYILSGMLADVNSQHEAARQLFRKSAQYNDGYAWNLTMSTSYGISGQYWHSLAEMKTAIQKGATGAMVDFYYGRALLDTGEYEKSIFYLKKAHEAYPNNPEILAFYIDAFYYQGYLMHVALLNLRMAFLLLFINPSQSFRRFTEVITTITMVSISGLSRLLWNVSQCFPWLAKFHLDTMPPNEPETALGLRMLKKEHFYAAEKLLKKAVTFCPEHVPTLNNLAVSLVRTGRYSDAIRVLDQVLTIDPVNKLALLNKGNLQKMLEAQSKSMEVF